MIPGYIADIGLEVHAELQTQSKMFCSCPVVDTTRALPNTAVCPVCAGMPGALPVANARAIEYALQVALALDCQVAETSQFARKNYFYPDLPKGYQISQFEFPLAVKGTLSAWSEEGWINIRIRRVHLEEDTAKLTHMDQGDGKPFTLVDLNRAGIPLLEVVSEPDLHSVDQVRAYTRSLRRVLQYLAVNSGDLEKGVIRFEANVSVRPAGSDHLGTRVEIKNLNSFRAVTDAITHELKRQTALLEAGSSIDQETLGWDETRGMTFSQRTKEEAHDYRYFPEPDLPPVHISPKQITSARNSLPERPDRRFRRFMVDYGLEAYHTELLLSEKPIADFYENTLTYMSQPDPSLVANWITGELFGLMNISGQTMKEIIIEPRDLASLLEMLQKGEVNITTAKSVLSLMFDTGEKPGLTIQKEGLGQISDRQILENIVEGVLSAHPDEVASYQEGKTGLREWFFGQVMQQTRGQANPAVVKSLLEEKLQQ